jgi:hypothetical protein
MLFCKACGSFLLQTGTRQNGRQFSVQLASPDGTARTTGSCRPVQLLGMAGRASPRGLRVHASRCLRQCLSKSTQARPSAPEDWHLHRSAAYSLLHEVDMSLVTGLLNGLETPNRPVPQHLQCCLMGNRYFPRSRTFFGPSYVSPSIRDRSSSQLVRFPCSRPVAVWRERGARR